MKIIVIQDHLRNGGTERQSAVLSRGFAAAGHDTTLLTFRPGGRLESGVAPSVRRRALQPFDTGLDWFAPGLRRTVAPMGPDVILCMGRMANCYAAALQKWNPASCVIATMRTGKPLPLLFRRALLTARHVIANSREAQAALVRRFHVPETRVTVIHNSLVFPAPVEAAAGAIATSGSNSPASSKQGDPRSRARTGAPASRETLRARHHALPASRVLLCVAMFRPEKNQRELIEIVSGLPRIESRDATPSVRPGPARSGVHGAQTLAAESTRDWQLWLAGDGPTRRECEKLVARIGLADRVKFVGFCRNPADLYAAADVAVHASWSESLSNFLIEAQASGLPVVAYKAQGISECFVPERTGWVIERGDRPGFRARLRQLMDETPEARARRTLEAQSFARTHFDPQRQIDAHLALFSRLTSATD